MPYRIAKDAGCPDSKPFAVVGPSGKIGCHPTKDSAERQMAALYANEADAFANEVFEPDAGERLRQMLVEHPGHGSQLSHGRRVPGRASGRELGGYYAGGSPGMTSSGGAGVAFPHTPSKGGHSGGGLSPATQAGLSAHRDEMAGYQSDRLAADLKKNGGGSYDGAGLAPLTSGAVVARPGHTASFDREQFLNDREYRKQAVSAYLRDNQDVFAKGGDFGTWDAGREGGNKVVFDVIDNVSRKRAIELGTQRGEDGVFDLDKGEYIPTGGKTFTVAASADTDDVELTYAH